MNSLEYVKCSPSGNITVLIFSDVERSLQAQVARLIIEKQPDVEQVGFVETPTNPEAFARLQMMGGEFLVEMATCALGWVLWKRSAFQHGLLEVSGAGTPIEVSVHGRKVKVDMPVKQDVCSIKELDENTFVEMEGISHIIVDGKPPLDVEDEVNRLLRQINLDELEAAGVMYVEVNVDRVDMMPIVWVRQTDTLIYESGCASGSLCVALWHAQMSGSSSTRLAIHQPSGSVIDTLIEVEEGSTYKATIAGEVEILEEGILHLEYSALNRQF